ncbi:MAG: amidohydrolase family protein [Coprococcus sp.]|nr:amidohydrolase family protein [Coprococcus sp.]
METKKKYALWNGIILNGTKEMIPEKSKTVLVEGKKIEDIVDGRGCPAGYSVIDLKGKYILPGLINMHVHLPATGKPKKKASDPKKLVKLITRNKLTNKLGIRLCAGYAKTELLSGVTTIRTVGGVADYDTAIRDMVERGELQGPRVIASNMAVSVPGGHMAGSLAYEAKSSEEAAKYVELIARDKPDLIKLMITGGVMDAEVVGEPGVLRMPPEYIKAACDKAHELGMKVAAHVESPDGVLAALENGVDSIEHGARPTEEIIRLLKEKKAYQISTISPALPYALFDRSISHATYEQKENGKIVFDGIIEMAKTCLANGIPVGLGTDTGCPYITHYDMWRELVYYVKYCKVTPAFALYSATLLNATLAGIGDITGSIEKGKMADMIVCGRNPMEDLTALRKLDMVIKEGVIIENPKVKKMPEVERELDKFL